MKTAVLHAPFFALASAAAIAGSQVYWARESAAAFDDFQTVLGPRGLYLNDYESLLRRLKGILFTVTVAVLPAVAALTLAIGIARAWLTGKSDRNVATAPSYYLAQLVASVTAGVLDWLATVWVVALLALFVLLLVASLVLRYAADEAVNRLNGIIPILQRCAAGGQPI